MKIKGSKIKPKNYICTCALLFDNIQFPIINSN